MRVDHINKIVIIEHNDNVRDILIDEILNYKNYGAVIEREDGFLDNNISVYDELRGYYAKGNFASYCFDDINEADKKLIRGMTAAIDIFRDYYKGIEEKKDSIDHEVFLKIVSALAELEAKIWLRIDDVIISSFEK